VIECIRKVNNNTFLLNSFGCDNSLKMNVVISFPHFSFILSFDEIKILEISTKICLNSFNNNSLEIWKFHALRKRKKVHGNRKKKKNTFVAS